MTESSVWPAGRSGGGVASLVAELISLSINTTQILSDVSVRVAHNEIVGLLGRDGAGKTSLFELLAGLLAPSSGSILLNDIDVTELAADDRARQGLAYLPEEPSIFRELTVEENVRMAVELSDLDERVGANRVDELLQAFQLGHVRAQMASSLSGGERRRCEVARALAARPAFLMLDEPFRGLDPMSVSEVKNAVSVLKDQHIGVLISDYDLHELIDLIDRAYVLHQGRVIFSGTGSQLLEDPVVRHLYLGESFAL